MSKCYKLAAKMTGCHKIAPGATHIVEVEVTPEMTAEAFGNPGVPALASPRLLALLEEAAIKAISPSLRAGEGSVGTRFHFSHLAPTPVGMRVRARATLVAVEGRRLTFRLEAEDERERIAEGEHERVVVELTRFLDRVATKRRS